MEFLNCNNCYAKESFKDIQGEYTCVNCGLVSNFPVFVDTRYDCISIEQHDQEQEQECKINKYTKYVKDILQITDYMCEKTENLYNKYIQTGTKLNEKKKITLMAVCVYITCEYQDIQEICIKLNLDINLFHKFHTDIRKKLNIKKLESSIEENICNVRNKLCLINKDGFIFKKHCHQMYNNINKNKNTEKIIRQLKTTKLFAVIGYIVIKDIMKFNHKEETLLNILNITRPTLKKIKNIIYKINDEYALQKEKD
jgi:hypothetical protein